MGRYIDKDDKTDLPHGAVEPRRAEWKFGGPVAQRLRGENFDRMLFSLPASSDGSDQYFALDYCTEFAA
jgi:hypothetical protein